MDLRKVMGFFLILLIFLLAGCNQKNSQITAPPDNISLEEVTKIDLKQLDLNKLSKSDIKELDGIKFEQDTIGYEMEYRYPDKPIKIKIIKFPSEEKIQLFWSNWLNMIGLEEYFSQMEVEFNRDNSCSIYAWQKGQWFTHIEVPNEPLKDKVKNLVSNHYLNLAKKEQIIK
ncbi:MAG: hypothetical protein ACOYJ1_05655 [Peptococcales bacterium]|jgi:hypothetical protein